MVIPEDDATRQLVVGFEGQLADAGRKFQVLPPSGGWSKVREACKAHEAKLRSYPKRKLVLIVDFDESEKRLKAMLEAVPEDLRSRVFVLGVWSEPEKLRASMKLPLEQVGELLAQDCEEQSSTNWDHSLLTHNASELERLKVAVRPILFP